MSSDACPVRLTRSVHPSPVGPLIALTDGDGALRVLEFDDRVPRLEQLLARHYGRRTPCAIIGEAPNPDLNARLRAYFSGDIHALDDIMVATGGTPFQRAVWAALREIPAGSTCSYGDLAHKLGSSKGSRAVGLANGSNPVCLVVPCHRVIGADGSLTGFGGGLPRKRWLLAHEATASGCGNFELALQ